MAEIRLKLDEAAAEEFYDIVEYYNQFGKLLSEDFIHEFEEAINYLINFPNSGYPYLHQTKRIFLDRFPYAIVYKIYNEEQIIVYAILHQKRKPGYWEERVK